jgi:hypothetical protein
MKSQDIDIDPGHLRREGWGEKPLIRYGPKTKTPTKKKENGSFARKA